LIAFETRINIKHKTKKLFTHGNLQSDGRTS
jgi:hypothetical protein